MARLAGTQEFAMGGIRRAIKVDGREFWTLFDTGARNTCVVPAVARLVVTSRGGS